MLKLGLGQAVQRDCLVCKLHLESGMALFRHLCSVHPEDWPYQCSQCLHSFNNLKELSSHKSNIHCVHHVSCKNCAFTATSHAKMHQHVCRHTRGIPCVQCGHCFPMITEHLHHEHLYSEQDTYECPECEAVYYTKASLKMHIIGKHSVGYLYSQYSRLFDSPGQWLRHQWQCSS